MKYLLLCLFTFLNLTAFGQIKSVVRTDSTGKWWDTKKIKPRIALGYQKSFFTEVGIAKHWSGGDIVIPRSSAVYTSLEWAPSRSGNVYGVKVGAKTIGGMGIGGLEVKYQTNFSREDIVITPKYGLTPLGSVSMFYGYNLSINKLPFDQIGKHQFSMVILFDKSDYDEIF